MANNGKAYLFDFNLKSYISQSFLNNQIDLLVNLIVLTKCFKYNKPEKITIRIGLTEK